MKSYLTLLLFQVCLLLGNYSSPHVLIDFRWSCSFGTEVNTSYDIYISGTIEFTYWSTECFSMGIKWSDGSMGVIKKSAGTS